MKEWMNKLRPSGWTGEFKQFLLRGNVIDLAVAVVIGAAFNDIVKRIVDGLIMPMVNVLTLGYDFQNSTLRPFGSVVFQTGAVFQACLNFVLVGFFLFLIVKAMNRFRKQEAAAAPAPTATEQLLVEIRDLLKAK